MSITDSQQIDDIIQSHGGWKADILSRLRRGILDTDPDIVEQVKWKTPSRPLGLPTWAHGKMICFAEVWKDNVKLIFMRGAELDDPHGLFNARLKSSSVRAIEIHEGDSVNIDALQTLVGEAIKLNEGK